MHHGAIGQLDALPTIIAIHGVVAADQRGDFAHAQLAHLVLQLLDEFAAAVRGRVSAVHEAMHEDFFYFFVLGHFQQGK